MSAATATILYIDFTNPVVISQDVDAEADDVEAEHAEHIVLQMKSASRATWKRPRCFYRSKSGHCANRSMWLVDGKPHCKRHFDEFWETHFVEDHRVVRIDQGDGY